jgi:ABC-type uncharacterized transport system permease subunit
MASGPVVETPTLAAGQTGLRRRATAAFTTIRSARPAVVFLFSLLSGIIVSAFVIVFSVPASRSAWGGLFSHPGKTFSASADTLASAYGALLTGAFGSPGLFSTAITHASVANWAAAIKPFGSTLTAAVPLAIAGLGLSIAYRSGVFSIGAQSQLICGAVLASWVGFSLPTLPMVPHVALGLVAALIGGALAALVPAILKARTGASEVIVTIMLNYIMGGVLIYLISDTFFSQQVNTSPEGRLTLPSAMLPLLFGNNIPIDAGVIVAAVVLLGGWLLLGRSRLGFEFELQGTSPGASRIAGVRQKRTFVMAFLVSGAVVGLGGGVEILGSVHQLQSTFGGDIGVLAITVAFVGRNRPLGIMLAALLYGVLQTGGLQMQGQAGVSYQLSNVIEAVIVLFMTAPALVAEIYRLRPLANSSLRSLNMSRGWGR